MSLTLDDALTQLQALADEKVLARNTRNGAAPEAQWTRNFVLAEIGVHHAEHRARALAIGEALGGFRDDPTSKGCTSPVAPIWIAEMVKRQG